MKYLHYIAIALLIFCFNYYSFSQTDNIDIIENPENIAFEKINVNDGLSTQLTLCMLEDKYGYIWIGTQFGLNRYDGNTTKIFNSKVYDPTSIADDWIWSLKEDKSRDLWACTNKGLCKFNRANESFTNYFPNSDDFNSDDNIVYSFYEDSFGIFWVITGNGLYTFNKSNGTFHHYKAQKIISKIPKYRYMLSMHWQKMRIAEDNQGNIWIANKNNIKIYLRNNNKFLTFSGDKYRKPTDEKNFVSVIKDRNGSMWVTEWNFGLWIKKNSTSLSGSNLNETITPYASQNKANAELLGPDLFSLFIDSKENIWVGGKNGGYKYDYNTEQFTYKFTASFLLRFLEDREGNIWMISSNSGVFKYTPNKNSLYNFTNNISIPESLSGNLVVDFMVDRAGSIYILTHNEAVNKIDKLRKQFKHVYSSAFKPKGLQGNSINGFYKDEENKLWISTFGGGLNKLNNNWDDVTYQEFIHFERNKNNPRTLNTNSTTNIYKDKNGVMWIGSYWGLHKFDHHTGYFTRYLEDEQEKHSISGWCISAIHEDSRGLFWILTVGKGLSLMDRNKEQFYLLTDKILTPNHIEYKNWYGILEDYQHTLWLWSYSNGIIRLEIPDSLPFEDLNKLAHEISFNTTCFLHEPQDSSSISSNFVIMLFEDSADRLWAATNKGLNVYLPNSNSFVSIDERHGLPNQVICGILEDDHGNLWVSTKQGISKISLYEFSITDTNLTANKIVKSVTGYNADDGLYGIDFYEKSCYKAPTGEMYFGGSFHGYNVFHPDSIKANNYHPPVYITSFNKFNHKVQFDKPVCEVPEVRLKYNEDVFSFEFIVLNYSNAEKNQYAYQLEGFDNEWVYCGNNREAKYTSIPPGKYLFKVKASNNDGEWNEEGDSIAVIITPPFWATWWFRAIAIFFVILLIIGIYLIRVGALERQKRKLEQTVKLRTKKVIEQKNKIEEINEELQTQQEEILSTNEELQQQKEEILTTNEELERQKNQILDANEKLEQQKELIEGAYHNVEMLRKIGQEITTHLTVEKIVSSVYQNLNILLDASVFSIGIFNKKRNRLEFRGGKEKGQSLPFFYYSLDDIQRPAVICFANNKEVLINNKDEYYKTTNQDVKVGELPESILYLPLNVKDKKVGVITVQSFNCNAYTEYHINIVRNLAVYAAIAIDNAEVYQRLEEQKRDLQTTLDNLKQTQAQLVQSEKLASVGQLTAGIAHEINNPINFISAGIDSLVLNLKEIREVMDEYDKITPENSQETLKNVAQVKNDKDYFIAIEEIDRLIDSIKDGTKRTTEIVTGLRTFSRLDEDVLKPANIHEGIDSTLILLRNKHKERIEIVKNYGELPLIECFPGKLNQVFMNLLSNAIDSIENDGKITITTTEKSSSQPKSNHKVAQIKIADTGKGIPPGLQGKIFEPFFTTKDVGSGTGLGLSIAKGIIEKHNGTISVSSKEGTGTEFTIEIPI